jgi:hypothetical protein
VPDETIWYQRVPGDGAPRGNRYPRLKPGYLNGLQLLTKLTWILQEIDRIQEPAVIFNRRAHSSTGKPVVFCLRSHKVIIRKGGNTIDRKIGPSKKRDHFMFSWCTPPLTKKKAGSCWNFFPGGKGVGVLRNAAERLGCWFVILTTARGMVNPADVIAPHDKYLDSYEKEITDLWHKTIPAILGDSKHVRRIISFLRCWCSARSVY